MNAQQSSIYRTIELTMLELIPMSSRIPQIVMLRRLADRLTDELVDALAATAMALTTASLRDRLSLLELISLHLQNVDTIVRTMHEWSSMYGQTGQLGKSDQPGTEPEFAKPRIRLISKRQYARYLKSMHNIYRQLNGWKKKTAESAEAESQYSL